MIRRNDEFYKQLSKNNLLKTSCEIRLKNARKTSIKSDSVGTIITSPLMSLHMSMLIYINLPHIGMNIFQTYKYSGKISLDFLFVKSRNKSRF